MIVVHKVHQYSTCRSVIFVGSEVADTWDMFVWYEVSARAATPTGKWNSGHYHALAGVLYQKYLHTCVTIVIAEFLMKIVKRISAYDISIEFFDIKN